MQPPGEDVKEASLGIRYSVSHWRFSLQTGLHPLPCAHFLPWYHNPAFHLDTLNCFRRTHSGFSDLSSCGVDSLLSCLRLPDSLLTWHSGSCPNVLDAPRGRQALPWCFHGSRIVQLHLFICTSSLDLKASGGWHCILSKTLAVWHKITAESLHGKCLFRKENEAWRNYLLISQIFKYRAVNTGHITSDFSLYRKHSKIFSYFLKHFSCGRQTVYLLFCLNGRYFLHHHGL